MSARTLVIANPASRGGAARRNLARVHEALRDAVGPLDLVHTASRGDAERLAREGVRSGVERIVVAGGDGTFSEVVTGLLGAGLGGYAELALLPLGTGGDLARTLGIPSDLGAALAAIPTAPPRMIDAGRLSYRTGDRERVRYFANVASIGMSGLVTELVNQASKRFGGRFSFLSGTLRALARYRTQPVTLRVDGEVVHEGPLVLATAANGRYFGGGMRVAPEAIPDDGLLDVVAIPGFSKAKLLGKLPALYSGRYVGVAGVISHRGRVVEATTEAEGVYFEADGEPLGTLPLQVTVQPAAIRMLGCAS